MSIPHAEERCEGALVLFSGGQDSSVCLAWALQHFERVETIGFSYGQRHLVELEGRERIRNTLADILPAAAARLGPDQLVDLSGYGAISETALTRELAIEWKEGGLPSTFVPARNLVFLSVAGAYAYRRNLRTLVAGMCQADDAGYPDCRAPTLDAMAQALSLGLGRPVQIETPLMHIDKAGTWALAHQLGGDALIDLLLESSHTCYLGDHRTRHAWGYGCGTCPACELRARGHQHWQAERGQTH